MARKKRNNEKKIEEKSQEKKFVFASDKLVNGSLRYVKGEVVEILAKDVTRWVKRGAMEIFNLDVGTSVLQENGEMPSHDELLVMDQQKKQDIIEDDIVEQDEVVEIPQNDEVVEEEAEESEVEEYDI